MGWSPETAHAYKQHVWRNTECDTCGHRRIDHAADEEAEVLVVSECQQSVCTCKRFVSVTKQKEVTGG